MIDLGAPASYLSPEPEVAAVPEGAVRVRLRRAWELVSGGS
jgi:hypothetical protein